MLIKLSYCGEGKNIMLLYYCIDVFLILDICKLINWRIEPE